VSVMTPIQVHDLVEMCIMLLRVRKYPMLPRMTKAMMRSMAADCAPMPAMAACVSFNPYFSRSHPRTSAAPFIRRASRKTAGLEVG